MLQTLKKFIFGGLAAAVLTVSSIAGAQAAPNAWSLIDSNSSLGTSVYGISITATGFTPPLPLSKLTSKVDQVVQTNSGTLTFQTLAVMDSDVSGSGVIPASAISGTIIGPSTVSATTGPSYTTVTTSNGYAAIGFKATVPVSGTASFYVKQFNGPK